MIILPADRTILDSFQEIAPGTVPAVDFHMHTAWTDGASDVVAMHAAADAAGLEAILFSEHARQSSGEWFSTFAAEVRALPSKKCRAYVGVETKVADFDGSLDITDEILSLCDLVMASVHRFPGEQGVVRGTAGYSVEDAVELEYTLSIAALRNPQVSILGHPFGMSYRRFNVPPPEERMRALIECAADTGVAFEVNAHYHPDPWRLIGWCKAAGTRIALGSNAHRCDDVGRIVRVLSGKEPSWIGCES